MVHGGRDEPPPRRTFPSLTTIPDKAKAELDELKTMMDRWKNTFKEMAKAPAKTKTGKKKKV